MVAESAWTVIVMNKEASHADGGEGARTNVIHELGCAQGAPGWERAIVLLEEGCQLPPNLDGTVYIEFQEGKPEGAYEQAAQDLEAEAGGTGRVSSEARSVYRGSNSFGYVGNTTTCDLCGPNTEFLTVSHELIGTVWLQGIHSIAEKPESKLGLSRVQALDISTR